STCSGGRGREGWFVRKRSRFCTSGIDVFVLAGLGAEAQVVDEEADQSADHGDVAKPLERTFPEFHGPRNVGIFREAAVDFRLRGVVQNVNHAGAANAWRIVNAGMGEVR